MNNEILNIDIGNSKFRTILEFCLDPEVTPELKLISIANQQVHQKVHQHVHQPSTSSTPFNFNQ